MSKDNQQENTMKAKNGISMYETLRKQALFQTGIREVEPRKFDNQQKNKHWSDCALHNEPFIPAGDCDCKKQENTMRERFREIGNGSIRFMATREEVLDFIEKETALAYKKGQNSGENRILAVLRNHNIDYSDAIKTRREWDKLSNIKDK